jgi:hypothetical protein
MDAGVTISNFRELLKGTDRGVDGGGIDPACQIGGQKSKHDISAEYGWTQGGPAEGSRLFKSPVGLQFFRMILDQGKVVYSWAKKRCQKIEDPFF